MGSFKKIFQNPLTVPDTRARIEKRLRKATQQANSPTNTNTPQVKTTMQTTTRRQQIAQYLGIKPISHGQVFVCEMIATTTADPDKVAIAKESLARHGSNLGTVAVVRDGDSYKVILGQEWLEAAQQLGVERLWVHVLEGDSDVPTIQQEMTALATPAPKLTLQPKTPATAVKPRTIDELIKSRL